MAEGSEAEKEVVQETKPEVSVEELQKQVAALNREAAERRVTAKSALDELETLRQEKVEAERRAAEEKGEYKELYEEVNTKAQTLEEQAASLSGVIDSYLQSEIEKVPEDKREAIPDLPPEKKLEWLQKHGHTLLGVVTQPSPDVKELDKEKTATLEEQHAAAMKAGNVALAVSLKRQMGAKAH